MDPIATGIAAILDRQSGVISRRQALDAGLAPHDIRRQRRRREWAEVHPGVYVNHTGPLTWHQRAWAAVLVCAPAALCHESAKRAADGPGRATHDDGKPIHVAVESGRTPETPPGVVAHRLAHLNAKVHWNTSPPRQRAEELALDLAAQATRDIDAIAELSDAVRSRKTTARRLGMALDGRKRVARRALLASVIADVAEGTCSALEQGYLARVERPHGLPRAHRQFKESIKGPLYRDAVYAQFGAIVELDGRLFHTSVRARDADLERDLDAFVAGRVTARLGWGQVYDRPCTTAYKLAGALQRLGWTGDFQRCPRCPQQFD